MTATDDRADALAVDPEYAHIQFGAVQPMRIEIPDLFQALRQIDDRGGIARGWFFDPVPAYILTRYDDVKAAFLDTATFSPAATQKVFSFPLMGPTFLGYEGRKHYVHRKVVQPTFSKRTCAEYVDSLLVPQAHAVVDRFCERGEADLMKDFAKLYPLAIVGELLGLPVEDWDRLARWANDLVLGGDPDGEGLSADQVDARRKTSARDFREWLAPLIDERRGSSADDTLTLLANGLVEGQPLTDEQIMSFMLLLFPAGVDTTWLSLGTMLVAMLSTVGAVDELTHKPEMRHWAVEETLRWGPPVALQPRLTIRDIEVCGTTIPAGSLTMLAIAAANRDPARFPEPDRWILERRPTQHLSFSVGEHFCLGSHLARAELLAALGVLLERLPGLRLTGSPRFWGAAVRGPDAVQVEFEPTAPRKSKRLSR
ncbi:cytochrome P450 [Mycolicibacterium stellerae]|uniref:cytochrome P450 n=1 Tax=Mycolicibacterium stellerae TaxID=2358193 RepID=UPI000F0B9DA5|nr:cytochrome P450 [Mycolicibacterium stellerae]